MLKPSDIEILEIMNSLDAKLTKVGEKFYINEMFVPTSTYEALLANTCIKDDPRNPNQDIYVMSSTGLNILFNGISSDLITETIATSQ